MVKLSQHTWIEIIIEFPINYKPTLQKMEDLLKLNLKTIMSVLWFLPKKPSLVRFFEKAYKIMVVTVFLALVTLVLKHLSLDLIWGQFLSKEYQLDKNNLYFKNISRLIFLLPKIESIFLLLLLLIKWSTSSKMEQC